jgi:hypothetical protein
MTRPLSPATLDLGVPGFSYQDLHEPSRLRDLYDVFARDAEREQPALWHEWDAYRASPDQKRPATDVSRLLVSMAPLVSRFVARLFRVEEELAALARETSAQQVLFRFKNDFVRRRVLPLVKSSPSPAPTSDDDRLVKDLTAGQWPTDVEMAVAHAGCLLLDRETAAAQSSDPEERNAIARSIEVLKRWCAARVHDPAYMSWVIFRLPEAVNFFSLVQVEHQDAVLGTALTGPPSRLRRRDGFTLTDPRRFTTASSATNATRTRARRDSRTRTARSRPIRWTSRWTDVRSTRRSPRCTCSGSAAIRSAP